MADHHREELLERVTDYVFEYGLIGLSLRPVAAARGTRDRMRLYHIGSRAMAAVAALPSAPSVRSGVNRLWAAYRIEPLTSCLDTYCQAAATGLIGREPYLTDARAVAALWVNALRQYLVRCGAPPRRVARVITLVDSALYGFHLDLITDHPDELARGVDDLARAAEAIAAD
jgi:hypothetical protein